MIDINQLQIGDWVRLKYTNEYRSVDEYVRINGILAKGCGNQYGGDGSIWGEGHGNLGNGDILSPIPLTAEILEKNGFEYGSSEARRRFAEIVADGSIVGDEKWHTRWDELTIEKRVEVEDGAEFTIWVIENFTGITDTHELQHALRLCGLDDLADNFQLW